jgi:cobalt-zinc-cadmium resistance protein CzcA
LTPRLAPVISGLSEVFHYTIDYAPGANKPATRVDQLRELLLVQNYILKPALRTVPGVAEINTFGGHERQIVVAPKLDALRDAGLTVGDLADLLRRDVENAGGSVVTQGEKQLLVRSVGRVQSIDDIKALPVQFAGAVTPLTVADLAEVGVGSEIPIAAATVDGQEAIIGMVMTLSRENSRDVARRAEAKLLSLREQLPAGMTVRPLYSRAGLVDATIGTVKTNLFEGAIFVVAVLFVLIGHWRAAIIVATAIPLAFLFALTGMAHFGISGNLMSLGAIDFGLIIDGAVVIVENVVRRLADEQHRLGRRLTAGERLALVVAASQQVASPMFFGVLIITVVYVPILALTGIEGKMFHPMALTVMLALGGALVLALTLMPALCALVLRGAVREHDNLPMRLAKRAYAPVLDAALRFRWWFVGGTMVLFAVALFKFSRMGAQFIPALDEGAIVVQLTRKPEISLPASLEAQRRSEELLKREFPEIDEVFASLGTPEVATDPMGINQGDTYVLLKPREEWRREDGKRIDKARLEELMRETLARNFPEQELLFSQPIEMRFNELLEGVRADLSVKVYGEDFDVTEKIAGEIKEILQGIDGIEDVEFETLGRTPLLEIVAKRDALARYNLHSAELNQTVATAMGGETIGTLVEGNRRTEIVLRLSEQAREDLDVVRGLPVRVGDHGMLPLAQVADLRTVDTVSPILRDAGRRRSALLVELDTTDVEGWVAAAQAKVKERIKLPPGVTVEFGGQFENLVAAKARLAVVVPAALLLIFVLIVMAFGRLRQAVLVYLCIPLAVTGGIFALWLRDMPFSITAAVGFIALSGVAVLNGVVLVSCFNELRAEGRDLLAVVREGALLRLRPVLTTALVAALGFVPMALATGPGAEVQRPLATVVIGGIVSATFLTLVVLPTLYVWIERERQRA